MGASPNWINTKLLIVLTNNYWSGNWSKCKQIHYLKSHCCFSKTELSFWQNMVSSVWSDESQ